MSDILRAGDLALDLQQPDELDVLDLPQIHTRPSAKTLLDTLSLLSIEPRSWEGTPPLTPGSNTPHSLSGTTTPALRLKPKIRSQGLPQYLTRIISSPLAWIQDDGEKEEVWDAAALRLSERSGRTGMGNITRDFRVPTMTQDTAVTIAIHEPALTEDNLGLKTWASSYVLAKKWAGLASHISSSSSCNDPLPWILELGAGTGLVGIAAATVLATKILLTDLPEIVPNLERNIEANSTVVASRNGSAQAAVLDWSDPATIVPSSKTGAAQPDDNIPEQFMIIVAADPIYSKEQPVLLAQTIAYRLARSPSARAVIEWPIREAYAQERNDFKSEMAARDLELFREESDVGFDDWSTGREEEPSEVECWMGMWRWKVMPVPPA